MSNVLLIQQLQSIVLLFPEGQTNNITCAAFNSETASKHSLTGKQIACMQALTDDFFIEPSSGALDEETQHKHMYLQYCTQEVCIINSLPYIYIMLYLHCDSSESLNAMKHSIEICLLQGQKKHYSSFNFNLSLYSLL